MKEHIGLSEFCYKIFMAIRGYRNCPEDMAFYIVVGAGMESWEEYYEEMKLQYSPDDERGIEFYIQDIAYEEFDAGIS